MVGEFLHLMFETWAAIVTNFIPGVEASKVLSILVPLAPAAYGILVKWRNSGYRRLDRLEEFLAEQEKRVEFARAQLSAIAQVPSPAKSIGEPAFDPRALGRALRKMHWGYGSAATSELAGAVVVSAERAKLARAQADDHERRQALAHLLLGARAASKNVSDTSARNALRATALSEFDKALEINPKDLQALEYAGLVLLEIANPAGALERFSELIELRQREGGANLARAYRLQASAFENLPIPLNGNANNALSSAVQHLPEDAALDLARTHEHQGVVRMKMRNANAAANRSFQKALTFYDSMKDTSDGRNGLARVSALLATLNRLQVSDSQIENTTERLAAVQTMAPTRGNSSFFAKFAKPSG